MTDSPPAPLVRELRQRLTADGWLNAEIIVDGYSIVVRGVRGRDKFELGLMLGATVDEVRDDSLVSSLAARLMQQIRQAMTNPGDSHNDLLN